MIRFLPVFVLGFFASFCFAEIPIEIASGSRAVSVAWSGDGKYIAAGIDSEIRLWQCGENGQINKEDFVSIEQNETEQNENGSSAEKSAVSLKFSQDGNWLLSVWSNGTILVTNLDGSQRSSVMGFDGIRDASFLDSAYSLAIPVGNGTVAEFFRLARTDQFWRRGEVRYNALVRSVDCDSKRLLIASDDGFVRSMKINGEEAKWEEEGKVPFYRESAVSPRLSLDGSRFLVAISDDEFAVVESVSRSVVSSVLLSGTLLSAAFAPDGESVASGISGGIVEIHRLSDGRIIWRSAEKSAEERNALSLAFSPDGKRLLASLSDGKVVVWDLAEKENPEQTEESQENPTESEEENSEGIEEPKSEEEQKESEESEKKPKKESMENSLTFSVGFSSLGTDWYSLSTDFGIVYRNYDHFSYPVYWLAGGIFGKGTPSGDFPYTYTSGGKSLSAPSVYSATTFGGAGLVYYKKDWDFFAFTEISVGFALRKLWNGSFSRSRTSEFYPSFLADFSGGAGWRWLRASFGVQYDTNIGFYLHGGVGISIPMSLLKKKKNSIEENVLEDSESNSKNIKAVPEVLEVQENEETPKEETPKEESLEEENPKEESSENEESEENQPNQENQGEDGK